MVTKLKYGNTNTFFISGKDGGLLVDTDYAGTISSFYKAIKEQNIRFSDITYVLATHYHPDHIGLISEVMSQNVKLLLIDTQVSFVHFSDGIFKRDKRLHYKPIDINNATVIRTEESRAFLKSLGLNGEIVSTPSHSQDTVIVLAITSRCQKKKYMPTHIPIESSDLSMSSIALAEQVRTVDKTRLTRYVGRASRESMEAVDQALKVSMGVS